MARGIIIVAPNDNRDRMVLRMVVNGSSPVCVELEATKADDSAEKINRARAALRDKQISDEGPLTVLEFSDVNPAWRASPHIALRGLEADSVAVGLRHSVYGWLSFVLPDREARALGEWLIGTTKESAPPRSAAYKPTAVSGLPSVSQPLGPATNRNARPGGRRALDAYSYGGEAINNRDSSPI